MLKVSSAFFIARTGMLVTVCMLVGAYSAEALNEAQALMAFKAGITLDPFGRLHSWQLPASTSNDSSTFTSPCGVEDAAGSAPPSAWAGIACDTHREHVTSLNLRSFNLSGSISSSLSFLSGLSYLDLSDNLLSGTVSDALFSSHSPIQYLNLSHNLLQGGLPDSFANLSASLRTLDLSYNKFEAQMPPSLGQLRNLKVLMLEETGFSGDVPKGIWQLPALRTLEIIDDSHNLLHIALPESLGFCSTITDLVLKGAAPSAQGSAVPSSLSDCRKLEVLFIDVEGLQGLIAPQIWQLPMLQILVIWDESLSGNLRASEPLPDSFASCPTISQLALTGLRLAGSSIPSSLGACHRLEFLAFDVFGLQGSIPSQIWQLPLLQTLIVVDEEALHSIDSQDRVHFNLNGTLPSNFSFCSSIEILELDGVGLTGEVPESLGACTSLQILDLSHSSLEGAIPDSLQNLTNLEALHLRSNYLTGKIPASLSACSQLESLQLGNNLNLSGTIPRELGQLAQLQELSLFTLSLTGPMPEELCNCTQLVWLDVGWPVVGGGMGQLPNCMSRMANLQTLGWQMNMIDGVVPIKVLRNLTQLQYLDMFDTQVRGGLPVELGNLSQLQHLSFRQNYLTGPIPSALGQLPSIDLLDLSMNNLSGSLPEAFIDGLGNESTISQLYLFQNRLQGKIPDSIGSLQKLRVLYMGNNELYGPIPPTLANCTALQDLDVQKNFLDGVIPSSLSQLTGLTQGFLLASNNLSGEIPEALGALTQVKVLDLSRNNLRGALPKSLENCSSLQILRLFNNGLTGEIEQFNLTRLPQLQRFTVHQNSLTGGLPSSLTSSPQLVIFDVQKNRLSGSLLFSKKPDQIVMGLSNLRVLVVSYNNLSSALPGWLWRLPALQVLDLSNNHFTGNMPTEVSSLANFMKSQVQRKNQSTLYEEVPQTVKSTFQVLSYILNTRVFLDVSSNHLEGEIADSFGELLGLTGVNLSHNHIQGKIPASLGKLVNLDVLDVSHNNLTGAIPPELGNLGGLSMVELSYNNLEGSIPATNFFNTRFGSDSFAHNPLLCGAPLKRNCSINGQVQGSPNHTTNLEAQNLAKQIVERIEDFLSLWGLLIGYAIGFLGVLYLLHRAV